MYITGLKDWFRTGLNPDLLNTVFFWTKQGLLSTVKVLPKTKIIVQTISLDQRSNH